MTNEEIRAYIDEVETRWRRRTPSTDILSALPEQRVGRSEMRLWFLEKFERDIDLGDTLELGQPLKLLFRRLRKEFPNEKW